MRSRSLLLLGAIPTVPLLVGISRGSMIEQLKKTIQRWNKKSYYKHDHYHCFHDQKGHEKHLACCLCRTENTELSTHRDETLHQ